MNTHPLIVSSVDLLGSEMGAKGFVYPSAPVFPGVSRPYSVVLDGYRLNWAFPGNDELVAFYDARGSKSVVFVPKSDYQASIQVVSDSNQ